MRITFNSQYRDAAAGLAHASERLIEGQRQVSTGLRVRTASDDPSAAAAAVTERAHLAATEQYSRTASTTALRLTLTDAVVGNVIETMTAAQVAARSAQGSTKTTADREAAAQQLEGLRASLLSDLNTTFQGTYIFAGAAGTTRPFVETAGVVGPYAGSTAEVSVDVGDTRTVPIAFNGQAITRGTDTKDIFAVLDDLIAAVRAGDDATITTEMEGLARAFDRATTLQTRIGVSMKAIESEQVRLGELKLAGSERISKLEEVDMVEAMTRMSHAETAYQAALGTTAKITRVSLLDYLG